MKNIPVHRPYEHRGEIVRLDHVPRLLSHERLRHRLNGIHDIVPSHKWLLRSLKQSFAVLVRGLKT